MIRDNYEEKLLLDLDQGFDKDKYINKRRKTESQQLSTKKKKMKTMNNKYKDNNQSWPSDKT